MIRFLYLLFILIHLGVASYGNTPKELNSRFVSYFIIGDIPAWTKTVDSLRQIRLDDNSHLQLLYGEYGLIGNLIGAGNKEEARIHLQLFENRVEKALQQQPKNGDIRAFAAAAVAYQIALQPWRAPFLSRAHNENIRLALEQGSEFGLPLVEQANSFYFRPSFVGGDKGKALEFYERAYDFFQKNHRDHWMYYNVSAWLGQVYANMGMTKQAESMYLQLLEEAPNFSWVRDELLPQLKNNNTKEFWQF